MELEKRLEKWDSLFQEMKELVETHMPDFEKIVKDLTERIIRIEERMASLEVQLDKIGGQTLEPDELENNLRKFLKSEMENITMDFLTKIQELREEINKKFNQIESEMKVSGDYGDEAFVKKIEQEIEEIRSVMEKLSSEVDQLKSQAVEKHRILREKKVEGRSPRIL